MPVERDRRLDLCGPAAEQVGLRFPGGPTRKGNSGHATMFRERLRNECRRRHLPYHHRMPRAPALVSDERGLSIRPLGAEAVLRSRRRWRQGSAGEGGMVWREATQKRSRRCAPQMGPTAGRRREIGAKSVENRRGKKS